MAALSIVVVIGLILLGMPLFAGLAAITQLLYFFSDGPESLIAVFIEPYSRLTQNDLLTPIPMFTLMGFIISRSGAPQRIVSVFGYLSNSIGRGSAVSLGVMAIVVCALFTPLTGASGITIVALGGILLPILGAAGYSRKLSIGIVTSSGSLGLLFFPSVPVILYGIVSNNKASIDDLFLAGIVPGLLLMLLPSLYLYFLHKREGAKGGEISMAEIPKPPKPQAHELKRLFWEFLFLPGSFLLFITGKAAITELGVLGLIYYFVLEGLVFREIKKGEWGPMLEEAFSVIGGVLIVIFFAMGFTGYLLDHSIPQKLFSLIQAYVSSKWAFLILLNVFLLMVGAFLDIFSAILVVAPIVIPVAEMFGVNMVHLGILFLTNLEIGYLTPPVGINLFLSSFRFQEPIQGVYRSVWPFFLVLVFAQLAITYIPQLSLWLF